MPTRLAFVASLALVVVSAIVAVRPADRPPEPPDDVADGFERAGRRRVILRGAVGQWVGGRATLPAAARQTSRSLAADGVFRRAVERLPGDTFEAKAAAALLVNAAGGPTDAADRPAEVLRLAAEYAAHYGDPAGVVEVPVDLAALTPAAAARLDGRTVLAIFEAAGPPFDVAGRTTVGAGDQGDGVERGAAFAGVEDVGPGDRLTVRGELRVIRHPGRPVSPP